MECFLVAFKRQYIICLVNLNLSRNCALATHRIASIVTIWPFTSSKASSAGMAVIYWTAVNNCANTSLACVAKALTRWIAPVPSRSSPLLRSVLPSRAMTCSSHCVCADFTQSIKQARKTTGSDFANTRANVFLEAIPFEKAKWVFKKSSPAQQVLHVDGRIAGGLLHQTVALREGRPAMFLVFLLVPVSQGLTEILLMPPPAIGCSGQWQNAPDSGAVLTRRE